MVVGVPEEYPNLDKILTRFAESFKAVKLGLQDDGQIDLDEIIDAIPLNTAGREDIKELLSSIKGLFGEVGKLSKANPWTMMTEFAPYLAGKLMKALS